jgi:hypothetical protein
LSYANTYGNRVAIGSRNLATVETRDEPGSFTIHESDNNEQPSVVSLFGQWRPGKVDPKPPYFNTYPESTPSETTDQRIIWFETALWKLGAHLIEKHADSDEKVTIAIPHRIGCGLAGGDWKIYSAMLERFQTEFGDSLVVTLYKI